MEITAVGLVESWGIDVFIFGWGFLSQRRV
jgi:hypothetical protein